MKKQFLFFPLFLITLLLGSCQSENFYVFREGTPAKIFCAGDEKQVVKTSLGLFLHDVNQVSGLAPQINTDTYGTDSPYILVGTLGQSPLIDELAGEGKIKTEGIQGKKEGFTIGAFEKDGQKYLTVVGSDAQGTAYGILELSRMMGVSPWEWWADATPDKKDEFAVAMDFATTQSPSVEYRGIFLNDEDWGLMPWSSMNFEPSDTAGSIGAKTYGKIFELLLRLRANTLWPAMHECSVPFYFAHGAKEMADKYGIYIGTSHCEPMNRNTNGEWNAKVRGDYDYVKNSDSVYKFWEERVRDVASSNNIYTIGMRGVHDGKMQGAETIEEQSAVLKRVIADQRELITQYIHSDPTKVPQAFIPYKEVLDIYDNGLEVPEDITLIWCDDNYGYIRRLSNGQEQQRSGGAGVYYHISYWGRPHDYLWLATTSPALLYTEMKRAWDCGARRIWILNVGDIKPGEYLSELFLDMAWNMDSVDENKLEAHMQNWYGREFGKDNAAQIAGMMEEYYRLAHIRKPEHMGWSRVEESWGDRGRTPVADTDYNPFMFGDEMQRRIDDYDKIEKMSVEVAGNIPDNKKDAYFELVEYPVRGASLMSKKWLYAQKARFLAKYGLSAAAEYRRLSEGSFAKIESITTEFSSLRQGKWNRMMDMQPRELPVYRKPLFDTLTVGGRAAGVMLWAEGDSIPLSARHKEDLVLDFNKQADNQKFIAVFDLSAQSVPVEIVSAPKWLGVDEKQIVPGERRLVLSAQRGEASAEGQVSDLVLKAGADEYSIKVRLSQDDACQNGKVMRDGYVAFGADEFSASDGSLRKIPGLGYSQNAVAFDKGSSLRYEFCGGDAGEAYVRVAMVPGHAVQGGDLRYSVSIDGAEPQVVSFRVEGRSEQWKLNMLSNQARSTTVHKLGEGRKHTVEIKALDDFVILDQFIVDWQQGRKYYEIPSDKIN